MELVSVRIADVGEAESALRDGLVRQRIEPLRRQVEELQAALVVERESHRAEVRYLQERLADAEHLFPTVTHQEPPPGIGNRSPVGPMFRQRVFHIPEEGKRSLVVFLPWMTQDGGAKNFLLRALNALTDEFQIVIVADMGVPEGFSSSLSDFLQVTPYVYELPNLCEPEEYPNLVGSILERVHEPSVLIVGSPWAYANLEFIRRSRRGVPRVVDVQFNHLGHLSELVSVQDKVDHVLVAHARLQVLLRDYVQVRPPVDVRYIAPTAPASEMDLRAPVDLRAPMDKAHPPIRIGWLSRNSPEKRLDLALRIAASLPEFHFAIAGSGLGNVSRFQTIPVNVTVEGWVDDPAEFIRSCDLLLNTSDVEGVSLSAMEALQEGRPVIARDVGGMPELKVDGHNGFIFDAENLDELTARLSNADVLEDVVAQAWRERLPSKFHEDQMVGTLRRVLRGVPGHRILRPMSDPHGAVRAYRGVGGFPPRPCPDRNRSRWFIGARTYGPHGGL